LLGRNRTDDDVFRAKSEWMDAGLPRAMDAPELGRHAAARRLGLASIGLCLMACAGPTSSAVASTPVFTGSFAGVGETAMASPVAVAVDQSSRDVYVADAGNHRIEKFDSSGSFILMFGKTVDQTTGGDVCTAASGDKCQPGVAADASGSPAGAFRTPSFLAVDNSSGLSSGDIYVGDRGANPGLVQKFTSSGALIPSWGDHSPSPNGQLTGTSATGPIAGPFFPLAGIAVDGSGHLWVYDNNENSSTGNMFEFGQDGGFITDWDSERGTEAAGIAADQGANLFVITGAVGVTKFTSGGTQIGDIDDKYFNLFGLALNPASDELYVDDGSVIHQYLSCLECEPSGEFGLGHLSGATGVALDLSAGIVYVADTGNGRVAVFGPAPGPPIIDATSAAMPTPNTAELTAKISPNHEAASYHFEYGTDTSYGTKLPVPDANLGSGGTDQSVIQHLSSLEPNRKYHYRVVAHNALGTAVSTDHTFSYPLVAAGPDSCTNAALRTGTSSNLPDCRAYELVTPPFKAGESPHTLLYFDSSNLLFSTLGAVDHPGDNPGAGGSSYVTARSASGWSATPLDPPASLARNEGNINEPFLDVSPNFHDTLFQEYLSSSKPIDQRLYLRRADGSFTEVGPYLSPTTVAAWTPFLGSEPKAVPYIGASQDLSHVLFTEEVISEGGFRWYWPGDSTVKGPSLYEWIGTHHSGEHGDGPALVGVDSSGQLISQCGTYLGGQRPGGGAQGDRTNAISINGSTIFFTSAVGGSCSGTGPPASELFARIDNTLADAHTVAISEPGATVCSTCDTTSPSEAIYQGASADGSKAFFLTRQPLLGTDHTQNLYEYNGTASAGQRIIRVSTGDLAGANVLGVARVSQDGSHVYFVASGALTSTPNGQGSTAQAGSDNLYVYDTQSQRLTFVTTLSTADSSDWDAGNPVSRSVETTPDGRFLLFASTNDVTSDASGPASQLYRYDSQTGELVRVSIGQNGFNNDGNLNYNNASFVDPGAALANPRTRGVFISGDGAYVFFASPAGLAPGALDDVRIGSTLANNIYEYHNGQVSLISDGRDRSLLLAGSAVSLLGASATGSDVYFTTSDQLVDQDADTQQDTYDARIGGGFPSGQGAPGCQGETCQGAPAPPPPSQTPASSAFVDPGNLVATLPSSKLAATSKPLTTAQKLAKALRACRAKRNKHKRSACEAQARRTYKGKGKKAKANRGSK
jgi:NHL repeat